MKKPKSFATFKDGHKEEIVYYKRYGANGLFFATESGVYKYNECAVPNGVFGMQKSCEFFKLSFSPSWHDLHFGITSDVESVEIDERVPYEYRIIGDGACVCGSILVPPDYSDEKIRKLIMEDLNIKYREE